MDEKMISDFEERMGFVFTSLKDENVWYADLLKEEFEVFMKEFKRLQTVEQAYRALKSAL